MADNDTKSSSETSRSNDASKNDRASEARDSMSDKSRDALSGKNTFSRDDTRPTTAEDRALGQERMAAAAQPAKDRVEKDIQETLGTNQAGPPNSVDDIHTVQSVQPEQDIAPNQSTTPDPTELDGFELKYGPEADRNAVQAQAAAEMEVLGPALQEYSRNPPTTELEQEQRLAMAEQFRTAAKTFELAAPEPGALRDSGYLDGMPEAETEMLVAEAESYRAGADQVAAELSRATLDGRPALETIRDLQAAAPTQMDRFLDATFSAASLGHMPDGVLSPAQAEHAGRAIGVELSQAKRGLEDAILPGQTPFSRDRRDLADALTVVENASATLLDRRQIADINWGLRYNAGRDHYPQTLDLLAGGAMAGVLATVRTPIRITSEMLDARGAFLNSTNAGRNTPNFSTWLGHPGRSIELMPGGQVRYSMRIDNQASPYHGQSVSVNYTNGVPDFSPFSRARVDIDIPTGRTQPTTRAEKDVQRRQDYRAATEALRQAIADGRVDPSVFSQAQLDAINRGSGNIPGLTWHHDGHSLNANGTGPMSLVPTEIHGRMGHAGWFSRMWE